MGREKQKAVIVIVIATGKQYSIPMNLKRKREEDEGFNKRVTI